MKRTLGVMPDDVKTRQEEICLSAYELLTESIDALPPEEQLRRACFIIKEIEKQRAQMIYEGLLSPVSSAKDVTFHVVATTTAAVVNIFSALISTGVQVTGQYAMEAARQIPKSIKLSAPKKSCNSLIEDFRRTHPDLVEMSMREAQQIV